jgi:CBS domain containing-hemolysin-like protein
VAAQATITGVAVVVGTLDVFPLPRGLSAAISIIAVVLFGEILPKTYALNRHRNNKDLGPWAPSVVLLWLLSRSWLLLSPALAWIVETIAIFTLPRRDS